MKIAIFASLALGVMSASANTNLLTSPGWHVEGAGDDGGISVVVDKVPAGAHSELGVFFNYGGTNVQQVFSLNADGIIQPIVPPPQVPGGVFRLTQYRDCVAGLTEPMMITHLEFRSSRSRTAPLRARGQMSNFDSLASTDLRMKFYAPATNEVAVELRYKLVAMRPICVDRTFARKQDEFRLAQMEANYISSEIHQNSRMRQSRVKDKTCPGISDCVVRKETFCADFAEVTGYLLGRPRLLAQPTLQMLHTNALPQATPTLSIDFRSPKHGRVKPQANIEATLDPDERNVQLWGNYVKARRMYAAGKTVTRVRLILVARDPHDPRCDQVRTGH